MVTGGLISPLDVTALSICEPCLEGKMTMRPFKAKGYRAKEVLDLVHTDLCGPMSTSARGGYEYFIIFIDDYSRYGYIYLMRTSLRPLRNSKSLRLKWRTCREWRSGKGVWKRTDPCRVQPWVSIIFHIIALR